MLATLRPTPGLKTHFCDLACPWVPLGSTKSRTGCRWVRENEETCGVNLNLTCNMEPSPADPIHVLWVHSQPTNKEMSGVVKTH